MAATDLPPAALELKDKGNKCFVEKDYNEALVHYTSALELAPGNAVLLSNLSATHLALKQWRQALERADECLVADPGFLKAYGRKAAAQMGLIRPGDAEKTLLAGLARDSANQFLRDELEKLRREEDGDQSPRRARDGSDRPLRDMQARVGVEMTPFSTWPTRTFMAAFVGSEEEFVKCFKQEDLRLRALEAKLPLTIVVVAGAQRIRGDKADPRGRSGSDAERGSQHASIMKRLIDAGARVDGRDAAGWTALEHATAHHPVLDIAEMLLAAGADPNVQDRFGTYPLVSAVMTGEVKAVRLLLAHGAKPDLKDNDGCDALQMSRYNPEIQSMVYKAHQYNRRPGQEKVCAHCGKAGAKKTCTGCGGGVNYCGRECQTAHWPQHKAECRKAAASAAAGGAPAAGAGAGGTASTNGGGGGAAAAALPRELLVPIQVEVRALFNLQGPLGDKLAQMAGGTGSKGRKGKDAASSTSKPRDEASAAAMLAKIADRATRQAPMKVKLQVPAPIPDPQRQMLRAIGEDPDAMLCYNEDRTLVCRIDGDTTVGRQLTKLIRSDGIMGLKGYFAVFFDEQCARQAGGVPTQMKLVTTMLPAQPF